MAINVISEMSNPNGYTNQFNFNTNAEVVVMYLGQPNLSSSFQAVRTGGGAFQVDVEYSLNGVTWVTLGSITDAAPTLIPSAVIHTYLRFTLASGGGAVITVHGAGVPG